MNKKPTVAELMVASAGGPSGKRASEGIEKAAAQAQVGEVVEGLTKEAKAELVGTIGWSGRVFGQELSGAMEPLVTKLASVVAEIRLAADALTKAAASAGGIAGIGAPRKDIHTPMDKAPNIPGAVDTNAAKTEPTGIPQLEAKRKALAKAKTIEEVQPADGGTVNPGLEQPDQYKGGKAAADQSDVLARLRKGKKGEDKDDKDMDDEGCEKDASLADIGRSFQDAIRADLAAYAQAAGK